jgi:hypothetical protein
MGTIRVESAVVAIHAIPACLTDITELNFITAKVSDIGYPVVRIFIYKFCHSDTLPYETDNGFLKTCLSPDFKKRPPTPHKN